MQDFLLDKMGMEEKGGAGGKWACISVSNDALGVLCQKVAPAAIQNTAAGFGCLLHWVSVVSRTGRVGFKGSFYYLNIPFCSIVLKYNLFPTSKSESELGQHIFIVQTLFPYPQSAVTEPLNINSWKISPVKIESVQMHQFVRSSLFIRNPRQ
jgi:hypothetical protein